MLTTDGSRTAAGRRLRIMHDEHRSARPRRRRQPHLNELKEISARSTSNRRFEVLTTQLAIFGMCAQHGAAVDQPYYMLSVGVKAPRNALLE
eukprot:scaffold73676_cov58-Phaeocystis_antarctica.AAC.2